MSVQELAVALVEKIEDDDRIDENETKQIKCLIETILSYIVASREKPATDKRPITKENSYNEYITHIWTIVSGNDTIKASNKRIILYAITQLQQSLWQY